MTPIRSSGRCLLLVLFLFPFASTAAPSAEESAPPLRWPEVAAFVARHPQVLEAAARAEGAAGAVWAAQAIPNPVVGLTGANASARDGSGSRGEWGLSVQLPLEFLATRGSRVASAKAAAESAGEEALGVRAQVLRALRRDFMALARAQAQLAAEVELEAEVAGLVDLVRKRAARGEARPTEVPRVEIELERLRSSVDRARAGAEAQRQRLSAWLGAPVLSIEADLALALHLPPLEQLKRRVVGEAPAVRALRARVTAASEELEAERWERLPKLSVGGSHVEELDRSATAISATITVPLWNWNSGKIREAEAAVAGERARLDTATRELGASTTDAWFACSTGQSSAQRFREAVLPRAQESARTMNRAYELGEAGLFDVIDTRRVLLDTRREYLNLLIDMQNACSDLAALAGLELP